MDSDREIQLNQLIENLECHMRVGPDVEQRKCTSIMTNGTAPDRKGFKW